MGNIGISGRQGRPERPADAANAGPPTAPTPRGMRRAGAAPAPSPAEGPAGTGRRGRSLSVSRGRDSNNHRVSPPPAPPLPPPRRAPNRSRPRSPLSSQWNSNNQDRLMDALFLEAMACSTCQRAGVVQEAQGGPQAGSAEPYASPTILSLLPTASTAGFGSPTPSSGVGLVPLPESLAGSEGASDEAASQHLQEVSQAPSAGTSCSPTSAEHVPVDDDSTKDVGIVSEADASSLATDTTTSTLTSSEQAPPQGGDAGQVDTKDSEDDVDMAITIESTNLDGFYFGAMMSVDDKLKTDYFEEVRLRTQQYFDAPHSADEDAISAICEELDKEGEGENEVLREDLSIVVEEEHGFQAADVDVEADSGSLPADCAAEADGVDGEGLRHGEEDSVAAAEATAEATTEPTLGPAMETTLEATATEATAGVRCEIAEPKEYEAILTSTEASTSIIVDDSSRKTEALDEVDADSLCSRLAALREKSVVRGAAVSDTAPELMEIARTSMALTAASSSVPDSESAARLEDETDDDAVETTEGAGDDTLVGCDMDLKHVAGGLFDTTDAPPPEPVQLNTLVKGGSLPAAVSVVEEEGQSAARPDPRPSGSFSRRRSATAAPTSATPPKSAQSDNSDELAAQGIHRLVPEPRSDLRLGHTKPSRAGAPSSHHALNDVLQNIKRAILPRRAVSSERRAVAKVARTGQRLKKKARSNEEARPANAEDVEAPVPLDSDTEPSPEVHDEPSRAEDGGLDEATGVHTDVASVGTQSRRASRKPSEEENALDGVKKNHVDPLPTMEIHIKPKNPAAPNRSDSQEIDPHPRSSRASIAPPRTNFLSENVLRSLARSSSIKYIDCTQRSNLRPSRNKTPERYRNVPPPIRRSGSNASGSTTASKTSSLRFAALKRSSNTIRKRIKTSETIICRESSNTNIECLADHKVDNKYYVYTVNDNKATELRMSEMFVLHEEPVMSTKVPATGATVTSRTKAGKAKKTGKPVLRRSKRGSTSSVSAVRPRASTARVQVTTAGGKTVTQSRLPSRQRRSLTVETKKNERCDRPDSHCDEETPSSISLRKKRIEILKRLQQQFIPPDSTVGLVSDSCSRVTDGGGSVCQSSSRASCRGDKFPSYKEESPSTSQGEATPRSVGGSFHARARGRRVTRYRPTTRTPRISCVGMNAGNESALVYRREFRVASRAVSRARFLPHKPATKLHHTNTFSVCQQKMSTTSQTTELKHKPSSARNRVARAPFSGLREVTEMLMEFSTLTAASGQPFANVSELVSLFEASTKASLPSVGNESRGAMVASSRPSIDEVLEEIRRVHVCDRSVSRAEDIKISEVADKRLDSELNTSGALQPDGPISHPSDKEIVKCTNIDTETKMAAALQEILKSLSDLRSAEAKVVENKSGSTVSEPLYEEEKMRNDNESIEINQTLQQSNSRHLHGLRYTPSTGRSQFEVLAECCSTITNEGEDKILANKVVDHPSRTLKVNTWTLPPRRTTSDSVQATVPTVDADCQLTVVSSPKDKSPASLPECVVVGEDVPLRNKEELFDKRVPNMKEVETHPASLTFENSEALEAFDFLDYSPDLIPRSHQSILRVDAPESQHTPVLKSSSTILRRNSSHGNVETTLQHIGGSSHDLTSKVSPSNLSPETKLTGVQRARTRIAGFLEDDVPATLLSVLTEALPLFLTRTKTELSSSRQKSLQHILFEDYFDNPANASEEGSPREDPQARLLAQAMMYQISLLVEDAARSAEMDVQEGPATSVT